MTNQNSTKSNYLWISIACFCSLNLYCQKNIKELPKSNISFNKKIQIAHYPLTAIIHNEDIQDVFLEVYPYDVSGNTNHGVFEKVSKRKEEGKGLYLKSSPPFYPFYSRIKKKLVYAPVKPGSDIKIIANPGKKFLDPDNNLAKFKVNKDGTAREVKLNKMIWDIDGDGIRSAVTPPSSSEININADPILERQLKLPFKSDRSSATYFSFPDPLTKNISGDFTVSFWLNPRLENICNTTIPIIETEYFNIKLVNGSFQLTRKEGGLEVKDDVYTAYRSSNSSDDSCHTLLENKWKFYGLSFKNGTNNLNPSLTLLSMFKNEQPISVINPVSAYFPNNIIPTNPNPILRKAKMMGVGFAGSLFSVRFFNKALNEKALLDVIRSDYDILRRKPRKNHYLTQGIHYKNTLDNDQPNRFNHKKSARRLKRYENIKITNFLPKKYDASNGYSVSFWTRIDTDLTHDEFYPFDEVTDRRFQFYYGKTSANLYAGMQRVKDKLGVNRYFFDEKKQEFSSIFAWLWEPGAFNDKGGKAVGWYHIVLVYYPGMMRVYLYHPDTDKDSRRLLYLGGQNVSDVVEWGIGYPKNLPEENYKYPLQSALIMDDFKVYSWPLSYNDVKTLHKGEMDETYSVSQKLDSGAGLTSSPNTEQIVGYTIGGVAVVGAVGIAYAIYNKYGLPSLKNGYQQIGNDSENIELKKIKLNKKCKFD